MPRRSESNGLSNTARVTITLPLPLYLDVVRRTKSKERIGVFVGRAIVHYMKCDAVDEQHTDKRQQSFRDWLDGKD